MLGSGAVSRHNLQYDLNTQLCFYLLTTWKITWHIARQLNTHIFYGHYSSMEAERFRNAFRSPGQATRVSPSGHCTPALWPEGSSQVCGPELPGHARDILCIAAVKGHLVLHCHTRQRRPMPAENVVESLSVAKVKTGLLRRSKLCAHVAVIPHESSRCHISCRSDATFALTPTDEADICE